MTQPGLDWDRDVSLPVSGRSGSARHASSTGAQRAARDRGAVTLAYVALLERLGPLTDHDAARLLGRGVSSLNSVRNALGARVRPSGAYQTSEFGTKRVMWELAR